MRPRPPSRRSRKSAFPALPDRAGSQALPLRGRASHIGPCAPFRFSSIASERFAINLRLALEIVERLLLLRQVADRGVLETALEKPLRRARRQHEQLRELELF